MPQGPNDITMESSFPVFRFILLPVVLPPAASGSPLGWQQMPSCLTSSDGVIFLFLKQSSGHKQSPALEMSVGSTPSKPTWLRIRMEWIPKGNTGQ